MTVGELIRELQRFDRGLEVLVAQGSDDTFRDILGVDEEESMCEDVVALMAE